MLDTLQGGNGADLFAYALGDGDDVITDFNYAAGDRVDLTDISYIGNGATASIALLSADGGATTYTISASNGYNWTGNEFIQVFVAARPIGREHVIPTASAYARIALS
ncbi:MAG: type I secretion C-terminal target domain-containing protein [Reyranellaceae bacterium]